MDLTGKHVLCKTDKYGNFTKGSIYPVYVKAVNKHYPENSHFCITDDEHDQYTLKPGTKRFDEMFVVLDKI